MVTCNREITSCGRQERLPAEWVKLEGGRNSRHTTTPGMGANFFSENKFSIECECSGPLLFFKFSLQIIKS